MATLLPYLKVFFLGLMHTPKKVFILAFICHLICLSIFNIGISVAHTKQILSLKSEKISKFPPTIISSIM